MRPRPFDTRSLHAILTVWRATYCRSSLCSPLSSIPFGAMNTANNKTRSGFWLIRAVVLVPRLPMAKGTPPFARVRRHQRRTHRTLALNDYYCRYWLWQGRLNKVSCSSCCCLRSSCIGDVCSSKREGGRRCAATMARIAPHIKDTYVYTMHV